MLWWTIRYLKFIFDLALEKKDLFWRFQIATVAAILKSSDCSELENYMSILVFLYFKNNFKIQNTEANYISKYLLGNIVLYSK